MSPDMFSSQSTETPWEWARARRQWFKTPAKDLLGGAFLSLPGLAVRFSTGNPNWVRATIEAVGTALIGALVLPQLETVFWRWRRRSILLDERERKLTERETAASPRTAAPLKTGHAVFRAPLPLAIAPSAERPRADVTFDCDKTGWARLRVTNRGAGATFTATIQLYGLIAGKVEGRQIYAKWELGDEPHQRVAAGQTQTIRLASMRFIGNVVEVKERLRAWTVHQAVGKDVDGVEAEELLDVTIVADPDLVEPCRLHVLLSADGSSKMARVGVDPPLERDVPQRVADMRKLLVEVADYVRDLDSEGRDVAWLAVTTKIKIATFIGDALGWRMMAVYGTAMQRDPARPGKASVDFLVERANQLTEEDINQDFPLPMSWKEYYERQPDWEWPQSD